MNTDIDLSACRVTSNGLTSHTTLLSVSTSIFSHLRNEFFGNRFAFPVVSLDATEMFRSDRSEKPRVRCSLAQGFLFRNFKKEDL
jgi:hypothetical protein